MAKKSRWQIRFFLFGLLLGSAAVLGYWRMQEFARTPTAVSQNALVSVAAGDGLNRVLPKLRAAGIKVGWDWQWKLLALRMNMAGRIHVGDYEFKPEMSPSKVLAMLASGDTARYKYTLVEGRNFRQVLQELADMPGVNNDLTGKSDAEVMALLGRPGVHPEGRFLPDTYFIPKSGKASDFLAQALPAMDKALSEAWAKRKADLPIKTPEDLLILASIVEKETGLASERAQVAGVFVQRLKIGMRLETDPTVIYGIGAAYDGNIRKKDLQTKTPYNTYRMHGLPPTPIAMPGRAALLASAQPAEGEALFFVANDRGEHVFSKTYAEHKKAVAAFQLKKKQ